MARTMSRAHRLCSKAVWAHSIPLLIEAIQASKTPDPAHPSQTPSGFLESALYLTIRSGELDLTRHLLEHEGAPASCITPLDVEWQFSQELLELLVHHGWDVNSEERAGSDGAGQRLVDLVCSREESVRWLVDKGARVDHGQNYYEMAPEPAPLLETCAATGSVSTFKFLRDQGARMGVRTLHRAAGSAAFFGADPALSDGGSGGSEEAAEDESCELEVGLPARRRRERAEMVRFLVDELGLEVDRMDGDGDGNGQQGREGYWGRPVSYAAAEDRGGRVVAWLLGRGAEGGEDVEGVARGECCERVVEVLSRWKEKKGQDG